MGGYSGAPAIRYLTCCEDAAREARTAVERSAANMPMLPAPNFRELPHAVATAWFNAGTTIGAENSSNIVGASVAYESYANANRLFAEDISERLGQICGRIEEVVSTDLRLPHASPQVELISQKIRLLIPEFEVILRETGSVTKQQAASMLSIAGGGGGGVELNDRAAQTVRSETETCMRGMVLDYREYARSARQYAIDRDQEANDLIPQLSAMRWEFVIVNGIQTTTKEEVDDIARQRAAATRIAELRAEAQTYRNEATRLEMITGHLEQSIQHSGAIFDTDCTECINCDTFYAGRFQFLAEEMQRVSKKFQDIRDSFCPEKGITDWDKLLNVNSQMSQSQQNALFELKADAMLAVVSGGGMLDNAALEWIMNIPIEDRLWQHQAAVAGTLAQWTCPDQWTWFLQMLTVSGESLSMINSDAMVPGWDINLAEIEWLQEGLAVVFAGMVAQTYGFYHHATEEPFYSLIHQRAQERGLSFEDAKIRIIQDLQWQTAQVFQNNMLLSSFASLQPTNGVPAFVGYPLNEGPSGPQFFVGQTDNGFVINFAPAQNVIQSIDQTIPVTLAKHQTHVSNGAWGSHANNALSGNLLLVPHGSTAMQAGVDAMLAKGAGSLVSNAFKGIGKKIIPGFGWAVGAFSLISSGVSATQKHEQNVRQTENLAEAIDAAGFVGSFQMYAVVTTQNGQHVVHMQPGHNTQQQIDRFNANLGAKIADGVINPNELNFPFPIESLEQLMNYQPYIQSMNESNRILP